MKKEGIKRGALKIQELLDTGKLCEEDVPELIVHGLNKEIVEYWSLSKIVAEVKERLGK